MNFISRLTIICLILLVKCVLSLRIDSETVNGIKKNQIRSFNQDIWFQKIRLHRELKEKCHSNLDCRRSAYICSDEDLCECAEGYRPDEWNKTCVGAIGRRCMYDSHCITKAYCKGQTICTCKEEFPLVSEDKWSCQGEFDSKGNRPLSNLMSVLTITFLMQIFYNV